MYAAQRAWAENTLAARAAEVRGTGVSTRGIVRPGVAVDRDTLTWRSTSPAMLSSSVLTVAAG